MQRLLVVILSLAIAFADANVNANAPPNKRTWKGQNSAPGGPISVPLFRRDGAHHRPIRAGLFSAKELASVTSVTDVDALQAARDALIDKYVDSDSKRQALREKRAERTRQEEREERKRGKEKRIVQYVATTNHNFDTVYSANLLLGTPPKAFKVLLDTGSSDAWVTASNCTCTSSGCTSCASGASWDPTTSSSYRDRQKTLSISYGSGTVRGLTGQDTASLGGFAITDQVLGIVNNAARILPGDVEGLIGFAFGSIARAGGTPWWLRVMAGESGTTVDNPTISFWLSRYVGASDTSQNDHPGGQFIIGGTNSSLYTGDITYFDVIQPAKWWLINLSGLGVQGGNTVDIDAGSQQAIIDTGTTLVGGLDSAVDTILSAVTGAVKGETIASKLRGFYALPCDASAIVTFKFGGQTYPMSSRDLLYMRIDDLRPNYCLSSVFMYSSADRHSIDYRDPYTPFWLVGAAFLKNVYSVYTLGSSAGDSAPAGVQGMGNTGTTAQVGFAVLSDTNGEIGLATGGSGGVSTGGSGTRTATSTGTRSAQTDLPVGLIPDVTTVVVVTEAPSSTSTSAPNAAGRILANSAQAALAVLLVGLALLR